MTETTPMATNEDVRLPDVKMSVVKPRSPATGRVVRNDVCTASRKSAGFVRHVDIDVSGTPLEGSFRAGQSFGVIPPGEDERGKPHKVRLYSIASPTAGEDGEGKVISTTVKRTIDEHWETGKLFLGVASNYLSDLAVGDEVRVSGPNGKRFLLPADPSAHDYVFFATGTGIAPFRGMVRDLMEAGVGSRIVLVMGAPYATDLLYHDMFTRLDERHENFTYVTAISREKRDGGRGHYVQDRVATHRERILPVLESDRGLVYICGVQGMEVGIFRALAQRLTEGWLEKYLRVDAPALSRIDEWDRRMVNREIKPTSRVFLEVY